MMPREPIEGDEEPSICGISSARLTWSRPSEFSNREAFKYFLKLFMNVDSEESENYLTHPLIGKGKPRQPSRARAPVRSQERGVNSEQSKSQQDVLSKKRGNPSHAAPNSKKRNV
ncbi:hypothetical protein PIB30_083537 [Stylosanthes scabra]|uniref:Uncharacterized protein n=1 Tax=Stylosanthes scabra TaxID=79078 RepID=A0ABU6QTH9_9FABA|nr:hypothetical protein [Stylosanthes scabra]